MSGISARLREEALGKLWSFAGRPEFETERAAAHVLFWGDSLDTLAEDAAREVIESDDGLAAFIEWLTLDYCLPTGRTLVEEFLAPEETRLSRGEREFLERLGATHRQL